MTFVVIGASEADPNGINNAGQSYIIFGSIRLGETPVWELSALDEGTGLVVSGFSENDRLDHTVSFASDINDNGLDDVILGGRKSYVLFGHANAINPNE